MNKDRHHHWESVYTEKSDAQLSWHEEDPAASIELADLAGATGESAVIDIGGGTSCFTERLAERGFRDLSVLDLSPAALDRARQRVGPCGARIDWIAADITTWTPPRTYDLWHDRAVFHFLVEPEDRQAYLDRLSRALRPGGHLIMATFCVDGPDRCSGLPVMRYDPDGLGRILGQDFAPVAFRTRMHTTPWGSPQSFQYGLFRKQPF